MLTVWLRDHVVAGVGGDIEPMIERLEARCRELAIEPPTPERVERLVRSALRAHEERFHNDVFERLPSATRERLDALLRPEEADKGAQGDDGTDEGAGSAPAVLLKLCGSPGRPSLASMQDELAKLELIRGISLPGNLFDDVSPRDLERCRQRVSVEVPRDLRRHPDAARLTWLAAFVYRNPDDDLPANLEQNREDYYRALNLPLDVEKFIADLQSEMREALSSFNGGLKKNNLL